MMTRVGLLVAILAVGAIAGCLGGDSGGVESSRDGGGSDAQGSDTQPAPTPETSDEAGALRVRTLDPEQRPVGRSQVALAETDVAVLTDTEGSGTFSHLAPGTYTVLASKPGYRPLQEGGRVVQILAGQVADVALELEPVKVVTAATSFHETIPIDGFIACSVSAGLVGTADECGKGVTVGGSTYLRDPNDNSSHPWLIDNEQVRGFWVEMQWAPTSTLLGSNLYPLVYGWQDCDGTAGAVSCIYRESFARYGHGGSSPVRFLVPEGAEKNITGTFRDSENFVFPHPMNVDVRPHVEPLVPGTAVGYNVMYQQRYELYISVFYGEEPAADFTALPTA
jgi:hypothetical protein